MEWLVYFSYFWGGAFLTNAIPHFVSGTTGRAFQSPFAKPPGKGLSSSVVNVLWGAFNLVVSYLLIFHVGEFDIRQASNVIPAAIGGFLIALHLSWHFGKFHGGFPNKK